MRESDLRILESLLSAITEEDSKRLEEIRVIDPKGRMTNILVSFLRNRISKLDSLGESEKAEEYRNILSRIENGRE